MNLRRMIVLAAPTCTLWEKQWHLDALVFLPAIFGNRFMIGYQEWMEAAA